MVRTRPAGARAHQARPPPAPVPRQVRAPARRGDARALLPARPARARPVRRLWDHTRAGARERARRHRRRYRSVQLPADGRQDGRVQPLQARARRAGRALARGRGRGAVGVRGALVRAAGRGRAARLPVDPRRLRARGRVARRARPRGAFGAADDALRPRLPARAAARGVLVPQAQADMPSGRDGVAVPAPLRARHGGADHGVLPRARPRKERPGAARRLARRGAAALRRDRHVAAVSRADRLPRAASLRVRAARARRPPSARARRGREGRVARRDRGVRRRDRSRARALRRGAAATGPGRHRRRRPPRPLPRDPRA